MAENKGLRLLVELVKPRAKQTEVAHALGVSPQAVSAWTKGESKPGRDQAAKLEILYGIPVVAWSEPDEMVEGAEQKAAS